jgi:hypothetical protein
MTIDNNCNHYKIIRFYSPNDKRPNRTIKTGLTLEQAQKHCQSDSTRKEGIYFDGYTNK